MFELIRSDFLRKQTIFHEDGSNASMLRIAISDGSSAMVLYRCASWLDKLGLKPIALVAVWLNKLINGCVIGVGATFAEGFVIMHPVGVVINSKVTGGVNITLESGVVIGDEKGQSPRLANHIFVGSGAKIIGKLEVGDGVKVGANAVLTKSAEPGATMLGIPAKPLAKGNID